MIISFGMKNTLFSREASSTVGGKLEAKPGIQQRSIRNKTPPSQFHLVLNAHGMFLLTDLLYAYSDDGGK